MAITRFTLPDRRSVGELAGIASSAGLPKCARYLQRAHARGQLSVELAGNEFWMIYDRIEQVPPRARAALESGRDLLETAERVDRARYQAMRERVAEIRRERMERHGEL